MLTQRGIRSFLLDGDNIRHRLNCAPGMLEERHGRVFAERFGLGFSAQDREENIRRIGSVAQLFCSAGIVTLAAFVSPYRRDRDLVRRQVTEYGRGDDFIEVFINASLDVCEARDPKGLYKKARAGELPNFTGIDDPYEPPESPQLILNSADQTPEESARQIVRYLEEIGKIPACETRRNAPA
jgi:adenylylsulfate kinase